MAARNKALTDYMQSTHGATAPAFRVQTMDSLALPNYAGRDRYTIALEVDGETVEVEADDGNAGAGTDAGLVQMRGRRPRQMQGQIRNRIPRRMQERMQEQIQSRMPGRIQN